MSLLFIWKSEQFGVKPGNCWASEWLIALVLRILDGVCLLSVSVCLGSVFVIQFGFLEAFEGFPNKDSS